MKVTAILVALVSIALAAPSVESPEKVQIVARQTVVQTVPRQTVSICTLRQNCCRRDGTSTTCTVQKECNVIPSTCCAAGLAVC
ncbi:hypothetical protein K504DRAFT_505352 [Pleomassaria siparia CBS 279.74]|uniref:Uncharacterized protein n=1 Tax=Pleomassaria siparia CBS 279.74 TaxID=1314801 RepID=A0A6G1K0K8_9PLEO|nr:hypothetical protein K504DRAFT_505352 [Pleomassaria siparia CBS 279.74]